MKYQGLLIQCDQAKEPRRVYIVLPEGASWIPGAEIATALFGDGWPSRVHQLSLSEFNSIPKIAPLGLNATLATGNSEDPRKIYLVTGQEKRWIISSEVMDKYDFEQGTIVKDQVVLSAVADGAKIT